MYLRGHIHFLLFSAQIFIMVLPEIALLISHSLFVLLMYLLFVMKCTDFLLLQEYVRGLCDPELQKEEWYPGDMHCIFAGARGLFLDRLVRDTSAEVVVPEPGRLRLLGRAEPVVMAQSRVQQFVALFQVWRPIICKKGSI